MQRYQQVQIVAGGVQGRGEERGPGEAGEGGREGADGSNTCVVGQRRDLCHC